MCRDRPPARTVLRERAGGTATLSAGSVARPGQVRSCIGAARTVAPFHVGPGRGPFLISSPPSASPSSTSLGRPGRHARPHYSVMYACTTPYWCATPPAKVLSLSRSLPHVTSCEPACFLSLRPRSACRLPPILHTELPVLCAAERSRARLLARARAPHAGRDDDAPRTRVASLCTAQAAHSH